MECRQREREEEVNGGREKKFNWTQTEKTEVDSSIRAAYTLNSSVFTIKDVY